MLPILFSIYSCNTVEQGNVLTYLVTKIYSVNTDGTNLKLLSNGRTFTLSQTGDSLFYLNNSMIYFMNIDGTNDHLVPTGKTGDFWLSSGKDKICFNSSGKQTFINTNGSALTKLNIPDTIKNTDYGVWDISPSGNRVVFNGTGGIYLMDIDGENVKLFKDTTIKSGSCILLRFTPDGNSVISINVPDILYLKIYNLNDGTYKALISKSIYFISLDVFSWNTLLFSTDSRIYQGDFSNVLNTSFINGTDAHYSIDGTKFSYLKSDSSGIFTYNPTSGTINHTDVYLPGNTLSNPHLTLDNSRIIFRADSTYYVR
jgi:hypothetical protein